MSQQYARILIVFVLFACLCFKVFADKPIPKNKIIIGKSAYYFQSSDVYKPGVIQASTMRKVTSCVIVLKSITTEQDDDLSAARSIHEGVVVAPENIILDEENFNPKKYGLFTVEKNTSNIVNDPSDVVIILTQM